MGKTPRQSADAPKKRKRSAAAAPDEFRGFSLQATRFLFHLVQAGPGDVLCLEVFEDVGVEKPSGHRLAEQDKSNRASNPLSDRSVELWKTVANWVRAANNSVLSPARTHFAIHTSHPARGALAERFHKAQTVEEGVAALKQARALLLDSVIPIATSLEPHLKMVFDADEQLVGTIISRLTMSSGAGDPNGDLRPLFLQKLISEDIVDDAIRWAHGWVKERVDALLNKGLPATIEQKLFHEALLNFVRAHDRIAILKSVASDPSLDQVETEIRLRAYVRQLKLIEADELEVLEAVNDFLRAAIDRTVWAETGLITPAALATLAADLGRIWRHRKDAVIIGHADKPAVLQGRLLYLDCIERDVKVGSLEAPGHFVRGSWHALADDRDVGWHPDYSRLLDAPTTDDAWSEEATCQS